MGFDVVANQALLVMSLIINAGAVVTLVATLAKRAKSPGELMDKRVSMLEERMEDYARYFDQDNKRLRLIEDGNKATQRALLALVDHALHGNNIEGLRAAKDDITTYLTNKSLTV